MNERPYADMMNAVKLTLSVNPGYPLNPLFLAGACSRMTDPVIVREDGIGATTQATGRGSFNTDDIANIEVLFWKLYETYYMLSLDKYFQLCQVMYSTVPRRLKKKGNVKFLFDGLINDLNFWESGRGDEIRDKEFSDEEKQAFMVEYARTRKIVGIYEGEANVMSFQPHALRDELDNSKKPLFLTRLINYQKAQITDPSAPTAVFYTQNTEYNKAVDLLESMLSTRAHDQDWKNLATYAQTNDAVYSCATFLLLY